MRAALLAWHRKHGMQAPWRESGDPYQVLVAAVMAQQTQMSRVLPKYGEFTEAFPTIDALASASTAQVLRAWAPLGYNIRALRLHKAAQRIVSMDGWPRTAGELQQIDGIGPFTAAIIASFAFGQPAAAIDVNVVRVLSRLSGSIEPLPERALVPLADALCSPRSPARWNQAMMDLGAVVCTSRKPKCDICPLAGWCEARPLFVQSDLTPSPFPKGKGNMDSHELRRAAEERAQYKTKSAFAGSTRYYRGRIVQALRELDGGESLTVRQLLTRIPERDGLHSAGLRSLLAALQRDGLVRVERGRVRLP